MELQIQLMVLDLLWHVVRYPIVEWKSDSLALEENTCLGTMCNMATWRPRFEALRQAGESQCLRKRGDTGDTWALCLSYTKYSLGTVTLLHY